ncbi:hypothetical protein pipiens_000552 [Culex pipiens pipiens]|uniref:BSD domain-containing protein n=1 Tax=Culex pipiens pipiens TaxID=38569 RepID=A0ABD1CPN3_CULPP
MSLSADRRNFVRAPPAGVEFEFDYDASYPTALAIMNEDKELEKMRFELVPKIITEESFWRNYFYRVSLICQAGDLGTLGDTNEFVRRGASEDTEEPPINREKGIPAKSTPAATAAESAAKSVTKTSQKPSEVEFVSDSFKATEEDLEEVRADMKKLGIDTLVQQASEGIGGAAPAGKSDEQWEKDLEAELQDFEVVADGAERSTTNWEKDVDELLEDDDETDLK